MNTGTFEERYSALNERQRLAVDTLEGPVLVIAGPGSGKTELLSLRVANILLQTDVYPGNILCLTFTDSAAVNMRRRLAGLIGQDAYKVAIHTFHNFCTDIISRHSEYFHDGATFVPADEYAQIELLEELFADLSHDNPLRKEHPEQGYVYLKGVQKAIDNLKKAGLIPEEFSQIVECNAKEIKQFSERIHQLFDGTVSLKQLPEVERLVQDLLESQDASFPVPDLFDGYAMALANSLSKAIEECRAHGKAKPLSEWKSKRLEKGSDSIRRLKDESRLEKMRALASLYAAYQSKMYERGFIDFADMILLVIDAMKKNDSLRFQVQEQFQYVLVDEFQDTNDAQMRLLRIITEAEVNEGRPNLMAVGDDDQAVYKFQGAEIKNIIGFQSQVKEPVVITLVHNYRSTQAILDIARQIILRGVERLENSLPEVRKELVAANKKLSGGEISSLTFPSCAHEYYWVASEIKRVIDEGESPENISVIARQHGTLERFVPYLHRLGVPVRYERQQNVLREPHIHQLIQIARFVCSLSRKDRQSADDLLPEILSYPFWNLSRIEVWKLSQIAYQSRRPWIDSMLESENKSFQDLALFLLDLAERSKNEPLEYLLEAMLGADIPLVPEDEVEDEESPTVLSNPGFVSPFKEYYFGKDRFQSHRSEYLSFLSSLTLFVSTLREYRRGQPVGLSDLVSYVEGHEKNGLMITDSSPFVNASQAVQLMTAHKAKGQEFERVFVLSCQNDVWAGKGVANILSFPLNLPIAPTGDSLDDQLRLFYVALTRAKRYLVLTSYSAEDSGKESLPLQFLEGSLERSSREVTVSLPEPAEVLAASWAGFHAKPIITEEAALLIPQLENYKMSVTHLNNFLNVTKGPKVFMEENLLRFPHPRSASSSYGSAFHELIRLIYVYLKKTGEVPTQEVAEAWLEAELLKQRLNEEDFRIYQGKGKDAVRALYEYRIHEFQPEHQIESNFNHQEVHIGDAHITGKIDKMVKIDGHEWAVHDFKTGKAHDNWVTGGPHDKIKLHGYRRQLLFYKLLIENSRDYAGKYEVKHGVLEFLEPKDGILFALGLEIDREETERLARLIEVVFQKVQNLDFPDVTGYSQDVQGIRQFEDDLLEGRV